MKNRLLFLAVAIIITICSLAPKQTKAAHSAGGEIIYVHLGDSAYQFIFKFYRDCRGPDAPTSFLFCVFNTCTNQQFTLPMPSWSGTLPPDGRSNGSAVSPGCSDASTTCDKPNPGPTPGYQEFWYTCVIPALPLKCDYWRFAVLDPLTGASLCCRTGSTNLVGAPQFYIESTFNSSKTWENSSPYYSVKPVPYVCVNIPFSYNMGALDPDGDSLWSQLINPLQTVTCSSVPSLIPFINGSINLTNNPIPTGNTFSLNGANGQMSFTSTAIGAGTFTIKTTEYRKEQSQPTYQIGSIMRDIQVQTILCSTKVPKLDTFSINPIGGRFINGKAYGCIDEKLEFCYMVTSENKDAILFLNDNLTNVTSLQGATITYSKQGTDTVIACFSWTPTINDAGKHSFIALVKDSTCEPPGILFSYAHTIDIEIWAPTVAVPDTSICSGESTFLGVQGGGDWEWTVHSGSQNSLNNPFSQTPTATPRVSTTYIVKSRANSYCKNYTTDTVNIGIIQGPEIKGQKDDTTCPDQGVQLDLGLVRVPNANYTISWTPANGLSATNIENPVATLKATETYIATISSDINRCNTYDTVKIDVLSGMMIENPDTAICLGQAVEIRGSGDFRYTYGWKSNSDQNAQYSSPGAILTSIQPSDTGKHSFVLTASYFKCLRDSITDIKITVEPVPTVKVNEDATLCFGDTMQLEALVEPSSYNKYVYSWTPGAQLDYPDKQRPIFSGINEGEVTLKVVVTTPEAGCTATDDVVLEVFDANFITMPEDTVICPGDSISLAMQIDNGSNFYWSPDFNITSISSQTPKVWPISRQEYTVYGIDKFGCFDTGKVVIHVNPAAILDLPDSIVLYPGESYNVDPGGNCLYYSWFPPLGMTNDAVSNPVLSPKVNTRYMVTGRNEAGCATKDSINVLVLNDAIIDLPNAFTPGGTRNGTLKIVRRGLAELKVYAIYNRWGTKVFETSDINEGWDGTYNGENQPMGVYIYTVQAVTPSGRTVNKQGNVTLIR